MSSYTPGPWDFTISPRDTGLEINAKNETVLGGCGCCGSPWCRKEDARLMAAAPELLEALKEMRDWYQKYIGLPACAANAAIAKATGEQA